MFTKVAFVTFWVGEAIISIVAITFIALAATGTGDLSQYVANGAAFIYFVTALAMVFALLIACSILILIVKIREAKRVTRENKQVLFSHLNCFTDFANSASH